MCPIPFSLYSPSLFSPFTTNPSSDELEWQQWGGWSQCTSSCGEGVRIRARACSGSDQKCIGDSTEAQVCKIEECPGINWLYFFSLIPQFTNHNNCSRNYCHPTCSNNYHCKFNHNKCSRNHCHISSPNCH